MKLIDVENERQQRRVIMYNTNHTKALYHNKNLMHITGNIYIGEFEHTAYSVDCDIFILWPEVDVAIWYGSSDAKWYDVDDLALGVERNHYDTLENFKKMVNTKLEAHEHFRFTEIEMMKHIDSSLVDAMWESRKLFAEKRMAEEAAKRKEREEKEAAFVAARNDEAKEIINASLEILRHGGVLHNKSITIYRGEYDHSTYSVINYLMREYGVKVPIKTQGWINNSLASVTIQDGKCEHYRYYKSKNGKGSTTIYNYMDELIKAVSEDGESGQKNFEEIAG